MKFSNELNTVAGDVFYLEDDSEFSETNPDDLLAMNLGVLTIVRLSQLTEIYGFRDHQGDCHYFDTYEEAIAARWPVPTTPFATAAPAGTRMFGWRKGTPCATASDEEVCADRVRSLGLCGAHLAHGRVCIETADRCPAHPDGPAWIEQADTAADTAE